MQFLNKSSVISWVILLLLVSINSKAQPGYDKEEGYKTIKLLTTRIEKFPDSLQLYEHRCDIYWWCDIEKAREDIDFLLSKRSKSADYLLKKAFIMQRIGRRSEGNDLGVGSAIPYYQNYFEQENNNNRKIGTLMGISKDFSYGKNYSEALAYLNQALAVPNKGEVWTSTADILREKVTVLDSLKKHNEAQVLVEEIHGKSDIQSVVHNVRFVKNYQKGKSDLLLWFEKNTEKREGAYLMKFMNLSDHHDFERYVIELCHVEYKLGNKETALTYLYNLVDFDPSSMIIYLFSDNERYWCFFLDLYDSYPNDYRVHVIAAYLYNQDAHELVDQKFNDKVICKLPFLKSIPYGSHDSYEKEIRKRALGEIEIAEKLSHNEFYLLTDVTQPFCSTCSAWPLVPANRVGL